MLREQAILCLIHTYLYTVSVVPRIDRPIRRRTNISLAKGPGLVAILAAELTSSVPMK